MKYWINGNVPLYFKIVGFGSQNDNGKVSIEGQTIFGIAIKFNAYKISQSYFFQSNHRPKGLNFKWITFCLESAACQSDLRSWLLFSIFATFSITLSYLVRCRELQNAIFWQATFSSILLKILMFIWRTLSRPLDWTTTLPLFMALID